MASSDLGQTLRQAREACGVSLDTIARRTNIARHVLDSIERNALNEVPGGLFTRGYVRAYAREVGLDAERIVCEHLPTEASTESDAELLDELRARYSTSGRNRKNVLQLAVVIACLSCLLYLFTRGEPAISGDRRQDEGERQPSSGLSLLLPADDRDRAPLDQPVSASLRVVRP